MTTRTVTIPNALGMHARAAARFVRLACSFQSQVHVSRQGRTMEGKSIMGLLLLAAPKGSDLVISAEGPDEAPAVAALCDLVQRGFGDG